MNTAVRTKPLDSSVRPELVEGLIFKHFEHFAGIESAQSAIELIVI
jgi:hypothetical protein